MRTRLVSCALWICVALLTIAVYFPILFCATVLRPCDRRRTLAHRIGIWWGCTLIRLNPFWRLRTSGVHHLHPKRAYVLVCNHQSLADIVILYALRRQFKWLAKRSLFTVPFLGWSMRLVGYIPLERGHQGSVTRSVRQALDWLRCGMSVAVFPEGTRSHTGLLGAFKNGAFRLAIQAGVPIVPIVLAGTRDAIPRGSWVFLRRVYASLVVLPPMETAGYTLDQAGALRDRVRDAINTELTRLARD